MSAVIQEKLVLRVKLSDDRHPLKSLDRIEPTRVERNRFIGAPGERRPLCLAGVSPVPLPEPQPDEERA